MNREWGARETSQSCDSYCPNARVLSLGESGGICKEEVVPCIKTSCRNRPNEPAGEVCYCPARNRTRAETRYSVCWECHDGSCRKHAQSPDPRAAIPPCEYANAPPRQLSDKPSNPRRCPA